MENEQAYAPDTVQRLYQLLSDQFGDTWHIFPAFPLTPPIKTEMPCMIVNRLTDGASLDATQTDAITEVIDITVLKSEADFVGSPQDARTYGKRWIELFVQGQDPITHYYRADTLYYVIRTYMTLLQQSVPNMNEPWLIESSVQTTYETGKLMDGITNVAQAQVRITTQHRVIVPDRR